MVGWGDSRVGNRFRSRTENADLVSEPRRGLSFVRNQTGQENQEEGRPDFLCVLGMTLTLLLT